MNPLTKVSAIVQNTTLDDVAQTTIAKERAGLTWCNYALDALCKTRCYTTQAKRRETHVHAKRALSPHDFDVSLSF